MTTGEERLLLRREAWRGDPGAGIWGASLVGSHQLCVGSVLGKPRLQPEEDSWKMRQEGVYVFVDPIDGELVVRPHDRMPGFATCRSPSPALPQKLMGRSSGSINVRRLLFETSESWFRGLTLNGIPTRRNSAKDDVDR